MTGISALRIPRLPRRAIVLNNRVAIHELTKVDGRVSQGVRRAGRAAMALYRAIVGKVLTEVL